MSVERNLIHAKMFIYINHILPHINAGRVLICGTTFALVRTDGEGWYPYDGFTELALEFSQGKSGKQVKQAIDAFAEGSWNSDMGEEERSFYLKLVEGVSKKLQDATYFVSGRVPDSEASQLSEDNANAVIRLAVQHLDRFKQAETRRHPAKLPTTDDDPKKRIRRE